MKILGATEQTLVARETKAAGTGARLVVIIQATCFDFQKLYILTTRFIYMFRRFFTTHDNYIPRNNGWQVAVRVIEKLFALFTAGIAFL
jgi:hypothetical protein